MSDFEEKLNSILSNPEAMGQIMNLAQSLNPGGGPPPEGEAPQEPPPSEPPSGGGSPIDLGSLGGIAGLGDLLGQIDPKLIQRLLPLAGELAGGGNNERMQLLYALRPFLKPERRDKVERAARTARLIRVGKKLLTDLGDGYV